MTRKPFMAASLSLVLAMRAAVVFGHSALPLRPKPLPVTQKNLVSLTFSGGGNRAWDELRLQPDGPIQLTDSRNWNIPPPASHEVNLTRTLSKAEIVKVIALINAADFPSLKSEYRNWSIMDAGSATLVLTYVAGDGRQKVFSVYSYGPGAPSRLVALQDYLWQIIDSTLPESRRSGS